MENQIQSIEQIKVSALDMLVKFEPKLLVALNILVAGWLGKSIRRLLERFSFEAAPGKSPWRCRNARCACLVRIEVKERQDAVWMKLMTSRAFSEFPQLDLEIGN